MDEQLPQRRPPGRPPINREVRQDTSFNPRLDAPMTMDGQLTPEVAEMAKKRRERKPFGSRAGRLTYPARPGYHRHWFVDRPGNIERATEAAFEHVLENGTPVKRITGKNQRGDGEYSYLMEIPLEFYQEDMENEQKRVDETNELIYNGQVNAEPGQGRYVPPGAIKIATSQKQTSR